MSAPVDVLAVMDRIANVVLPVKLWDGSNRYCGSNGREGSEYQNDLVALIDARAAVAELVEAAKASIESFDSPTGSTKRDQLIARVNLRAALAKFGSAA